MKLIYCASGNQRFAQISIDAGFLYGAQMPSTVYYPPHFIDQDWRKPDRARYMAAAREHRPHMATVLDWERDEQLPEVLSWAEEIAQYVEQVVIIPKVIGGVPRIPDRIGGKEVILGYSVPTRYSGTSVPVWEFGRRPVHLLGGSPLAQLNAASYLNVVSADGNYMMKMATQHCQFFVYPSVEWSVNRHWPTVREANDGVQLLADDLPYEAFRRSCTSIMKMWS